eukprot:gnl/TRDRNA2_/TRDRNA2_125337_c1_seq4.p1 gnl/TRDRNA2_/TRDRNA2_125337_c1~~gnl/TRDRNA2_/TRDRNA2_125337_c1_seq4.p1  ORF type:complete len:339 (+),score=32.05 gnl/TRDRNA2_/TRDRNA2_125337_c1_seq4:1-1017(+)
MCKALLEHCRQLSHAAPVGITRGPSLDILAFAHVRPLLTAHDVEQREDPSVRGFRFQPLFHDAMLSTLSSHAHVGFDRQHTWRATIAAVVRQAVAAANAAAAPGAQWQAPAAAHPIFVDLPWVEEACGSQPTRRALFVWVRDFVLSAGYDVELLVDTPAAAADLLQFVESEMSSAGGLECLRHLLKLSSVRAAAVARKGLPQKLLEVCDGLPSIQGVTASSGWVPSERADACAALTCLLEDASEGSRWATNMLPLQGPLRALRWVSKQTVDVAAAYTCLRLMVARGGLPLAREVWRLCSVTFENANALRIAIGLGDVAGSAGASECIQPPLALSHEAL